ncbi:phosphomannomutase [Aliiroseovarius halocynthiae]|uniref:Phosphomannomutase n=1 Tax=Aliiroseovarius halocynthiae TaxID=985055 RepID=A0A545SWQ5_9RHOB|nr:phosphomannomutase [Aliiroseovarius halocynthiae]TQV69391.1 phosphomannomutase [Aliiroseovarius halocynthiae]SMR72780.1 phosphomannomutase [Aliiroseovarius halocynthiae]
MPPKFGTSGLRGLVTDLTPQLVGSHVAAFIRACPTGSGLFVGRDLRPSSADIAGMVAQAAHAAGLQVTDCGDIPTPALALAAMSAGASAVMITGSHIPADRNGLKFYTPEGEITKAHETAILATLSQADSPAPSTAAFRNTTAGQEYADRYVTAFGTSALEGLRIGVYSHSAVGRDLLMDLVVALGGEVIELGRSAHFIPVDTEAVSPELRRQLRLWAREHELYAIISTDGDGDRPLLTDETGWVIVGDVLGQITGAALGAAVAVTPVSSNSGAETVFDHVIRTRIGSPYVIAGMETAAEQVVGYEANGGFLLGFHANGLPPLMTRDAVLPLLVPLIQARTAGALSALVAQQPAHFTASDRLQEVPTERSRTLIASLSTGRSAQAAFLAKFGGALGSTDQTDGLRMTLKDGRIVHLRPSGNAPELRLYTEASSPDVAQEMLSLGLATLKELLDS